MGFLKKIGKSIKKTVKKVGKVQSSVIKGVGGALSGVPIIGDAASQVSGAYGNLLQGKVSQGIGDAFDALPAAAQAYAGVATLGGSSLGTGFLGGSQAVGQPLSIGDILQTTATDLLQGASQNLQCAVLGNCAEQAQPQAAVQTFVPTGNTPANTQTSIGPSMNGNILKYALIAAGIFAVYTALKKS